jgi:crotonobetaine/carnitine-CoA ligase
MPVLPTRQLLERNARERPDAVFAVFLDGSWTNAEVDRYARSVAGALADAGVRPGDHVASWLPNGPEALLSLFGVNAAGAVQAPLNTAYRGQVLEHALNSSQAAVLIAHPALVERLAGCELPYLKLLVVTGDPDGRAAPVMPSVRVRSWTEFVTAAPREHADLPDREPSDDMVILMTSGTTGPSKAVRCSYTHHEHYGAWYQADGQGGRHRYLTVMPMFHVGGTGLVTGALSAGGSVAVLPRFSTSSFWADVRALGATVATLADAMASFLLEAPPAEADQDHPLELVFMTGLFSSRFTRRFGVEPYCGFAMTEVPGPLRAYPLSDRYTCGQPWGDWEVGLVDDDDLPVPDGTPGELVVRHREPWVITSGYLNRPDADAEAWRNGWFHTGDQMVRDERGNFFFKDRKKDSIRRRGENISSFEVEAGLLAHPEVIDVAVVAVRAAEGEDDVMAFIVGAGPDRTPGPEALTAFAVERLPHYMVPRYLQFVDELPKTPTGKIKKAELRARGVGPGAWDREQSGISVKSARF